MRYAQKLTLEILILLLISINTSQANIDGSVTKVLIGHDRTVTYADLCLTFVKGTTENFIIVEDISDCHLARNYQKKLGTHISLSFGEYFLDQLKENFRPNLLAQYPEMNFIYSTRE